MTRTMPWPLAAAIIAALITLGCDQPGREATSELCWTIGFDYRNGVALYTHEEGMTTSEFYDEMEDKGISRNTIQDCLDYFKRSFREGTEAGFEARNRSR